MSAPMFEWAGRMIRGALAELDAKVALCKEMGYPMPEGNTSRTSAEIDLLALAEKVLYAPDDQARDGARQTLAEAIAESGHGTPENR
jgi:hypothetical protein